MIEYYFIEFDRIFYDIILFDRIFAAGVNHHDNHLSLITLSPPAYHLWLITTTMHRRLPIRATLFFV